MKEENISKKNKNKPNPKPKEPSKKESNSPSKNISRTTIFLNQKKGKTDEEAKTSIYYPRYGKVSSTNKNTNNDL